MTEKNKAVKPAKSNARSNGPAQTAPTITVTKAHGLTAEQAELQFRFRVYCFIGVLKHLSKCNDPERKQLARFIDACCDRLHKATSDLLVEALRSPKFKNCLKRERALQFATFEKMGKLIERRKRL